MSKLIIFLNALAVFLFALALVIFVTSCAPNNQQHVSTEWSMTWNCNGNSSCASHMRAWYGSGQFDSQNSCLVWETEFLNSFGAPYDSCTACTGN